MSDGCANCAALASENARLRTRIGELVGGIRSITAFIGRETEKPTMPRQKLIPAITARLNALRQR